MPDRVIEFLDLVPEDELRGVTTSVAFSWSNRHPEDAVNWLLQHDDPKTREFALAVVASSWFGSLPHRAYTWLEGAPPEIQDEVRAAVATRGMELK